MTVDVSQLEWLPKEEWEGYLEMRKAMKKKPTDYAVKLILKRLEKWNSSGMDIAQVLQNSIMKNWIDVYELKDAKPTAKWWETQEGVLAKGLEFGMSPRPGEGRYDFQKRINAVIDAGGKERMSMSREFSHQPELPETLETATSRANRDVARANLQLALQASKVRH